MKMCITEGTLDKNELEKMADRQSISNCTGRAETEEVPGQADMLLASEAPPLMCALQLLSLGGGVKASKGVWPDKGAGMSDIMKNSTAAFH